MPPCISTPVPPISIVSGDLLVDLLEFEDVAFGGLGPFERTVEGAKGAVLGAEVGVVDVAIDDVADNALGVQAAAHRIGLKTKADQVRRVKVVERLLASQCHIWILPIRRFGGFGGVNKGLRFSVNVVPGTAVLPESCEQEQPSSADLPALRAGEV